MQYEVVCLNDSEMITSTNKMVKMKCAGNRKIDVVSSGIEPESRASETLILSIVLRDHVLVGSR